MVLFGVSGLVDGVYFHDYKYKLYRYKESILEHIIHTFRSAAFPHCGLLFISKRFWRLAHDGRSHGGMH